MICAELPLSLHSLHLRYTPCWETVNLILRNQSKADGRAANQRVSISFVVGAEHAAEAAERGAWKDAGKRVGLTAILRTALVGERERRSERGRRRWLLQSADLLRAVGIRTAARSKRQHCSGRHPSHLEALPQPHRQLGRRALLLRSGYSPRMATRPQSK